MQSRIKSLLRCSLEIYPAYYDFDSSMLRRNGYNAKIISAASADPGINPLKNVS